MEISAKKAADMVLTGIEWEVAFFDFVDSFRKSNQKEILIAEVPSSTNDSRLDSLLKSMVLYLCDEVDMPSIFFN